MIEDSEWKIPEEERADVLSALAYFSDPEDLVPDHIPVLGFLDDAIMIELVAEELKDDIEAFLKSFVLTVLVKKAVMAMLLLVTNG